MYIKNCKKCNNEFSAKRSDANYCSNNCRASYRQRILKQTIKEYKAEYYLRNKEAIDRRNKKPLKQVAQKQCTACNIVFETKRDNAQCCSRLCSMANWRKNNVDKQNTYFKNLYHNSIERRLATCIRSRVNKALKGVYKPSSITKNLGCTPADLIKHIESMWTIGMSWDNYGKGKDKWNIDHIKPLAKFDLTDVKQFSEACNYKNLQPLWQTDNLIKGAK